MRRTRVTGWVNGEVIVEATGMLRESVEFVLKSVTKQLDNGLLESIDLESTTGAQISVRISALPSSHTETTR